MVKRLRVIIERAEKMPLFKQFSKKNKPEDAIQHAQFIHCEKCASNNLVISNSAVIRHPHEWEHGTIMEVEYSLTCANCGSVGYIKEMWQDIASIQKMFTDMDKKASAAKQAPPEEAPDIGVLRTYLVALNEFYVRDTQVLPGDTEPSEDSDGLWGDFTGDVIIGRVQGRDLSRADAEIQASKSFGYSVPKLTLHELV